MGIEMEQVNHLSDHVNGDLYTMYITEPIDQLSKVKVKTNEKKY